MPSEEAGTTGWGQVMKVLMSNIKAYEHCPRANRNPTFVDDY